MIHAVGTGGDCVFTKAHLDNNRKTLWRQGFYFPRETCGMKSQTLLKTLLDDRVFEGTEAYQERI